MKYAIGPRREIGIRVIFNVLGPLTNPAGARRQLIGVYDSDLTETLAEVLGQLGSERALVVHGLDGLDEITLTAPSRVSELKDGDVKSYEVTPEDFGLSRSSGEDLKGGDAETNADILQSVLVGQKGPPRDVVLLNAAAALVAGGKSEEFSTGVEIAAGAIDSGMAMQKLEGLIAESNT